MNNVRQWMVGLTIVSLLAIGVVALAGNGFGDSTQDPNPPQAATGDCGLHERDADGDGIVNSEDADWVCPLDGTGYGECKGYGQNLSVNRPLDGSGFGSGEGGGLGRRGGSRGCDGGCL